MSSTHFHLNFLVIALILSKNLMVFANFNLFMDRREFQKLHGISSDIYYVREGVVNEYAASFLVTVPVEVEDLNFSWQALNKRPVHYEMSMEYTDFITLSRPYTNISSSGRVPQNLETFRVTLPCSGRNSAEVPVTIRMSFQVKHHAKSNTTNLGIKRNKICLFREPTTTTIGTPTLKPFLFEESFEKPDETQKSNTIHHSLTTIGESSVFTDPTPSVLLAGLLGGCAVTASAVFLTFFICLKRKFLNSSHSTPEMKNRIQNDGGTEHDNDHDHSSPACLIRQSNRNHVHDDTLPSTWKTFGPDKSNHPLPRSGSHNSYVTVASFWNDVLNPTSNSNTSQHLHQQKPKGHFGSSALQFQGKGADVSPYAYAHILPPPTAPPPNPPTFSAPPVSMCPTNYPEVVEWYTKYPSATNSTQGHIYANNLQSFSPKTESTMVHTNYSTMKSTAESLIQIDGFQCKRNLISSRNNTNSPVERFL